MSPSRVLPLLNAADCPVQDGRSSPGQETVDYDHMEVLGEAFAEPDLDATISDLVREIPAVHEPWGTSTPPPVLPIAEVPPQAAE
eukprot:762147-Pyramimonas_sp.AAC.1